ncbi:MAG: serine hydrolase [Robiginitalea sp.]
MRTPVQRAILILSLFVLFPLFAQIDSVQIQEIDSLFIRWNRPNHPGGAIGVVKDGKTIFSRAYGLASLEYLVPNSTGTIFNTGSVSKQFTAMGIVRLEEQGMLSFDDEIHKYIPELPDFEHPITIRQMLHHTSGLRSLHALFALAGWRDDDARTNEDLNRIILKQQDLNFEPGAEYLYCNTGYMLMVNIIEKVTGVSFPGWMQEQIFIPLGMVHTYVEDQYDRVVPDNATSYYGREEFDRAVEYWGYVGSGNMHSTTADLLKWLSNFRSPQKGWASAFRTLQTLDPLNDGTPNEYAFGVVVDEHLGKKRIRHGGAIGGFRAFIAAYPEAGLDIAVLTNFSAGNPGGNADRIAEIVLGKPDGDKSESGPPAAIQLKQEDLSVLEGAYWNNREKYLRKIYLKSDTLRYWRSENSESALVPVDKDTFKMLGAGDAVRVTFEPLEVGQRMKFMENGMVTAIFDMVEDTENSEGQLPEYTGAYYSPEIENTYTVTLQAGALQLYHPRHGDIPLKRLFPDVYSGEWPVGTVEFQRNPAGRVTGILISNGRVRNAWFEKQ